MAVSMQIWCLPSQPRPQGSWVRSGSAGPQFTKLATREPPSILSSPLSPTQWTNVSARPPEWKSGMGLRQSNLLTPPLILQPPHPPPENDGYSLMSIWLPVSSHPVCFTHCGYSCTPQKTNTHIPFPKCLPTDHTGHTKSWTLLSQTYLHRFIKHSFVPQHTHTHPPHTSPCLAGWQTLINPSLNIQQKCYLLLFPAEENVSSFGLS